MEKDRLTSEFQRRLKNKSLSCVEIPKNDFLSVEIMSTYHGKQEGRECIHIESQTIEIVKQGQNDETM